MPDAGTELARLYARAEELVNRGGARPADDQPTRSLRGALGRANHDAKAVWSELARFVTAVEAEMARARRERRRRGEAA